MSASTPAAERHTFHARSNAGASMAALLAIVSRDLLVMRREALVFLTQTLIQPLLLLFVFGKILPSIGTTNAGFSTLLLPGVVALTVFLTAFQGPAVDLARDLGVTLEIEDRLLAPLPIALVAIEKVMLAVLRALIGGALVFPLAFWILGSGYQVRTDLLGVLIGLMVLVALMGATLGLLLAAVAPIQLLPVIFALIFTPLIFTGCTFYPWASLGAIRWYQVLTLFNPLTYASEGLRYAMIPPIQGQTQPTLAIGWIMLM
ncbi:MAG TPA: ABC transporter permease, partial [Ktedonobacterales bacterium]|nr:ABC transporter permease [Ktedonobacterales bacterium]